MGEMADYALDQVAQHEALCDDYVSGYVSLEDAYDNGLIDSSGREIPELQDAWDRNGIPTAEYLNNELSHAMKNLEIASLSSGSAVNMGSKQAILNKAALDNLSKPNPTCNWCGEQMLAREGKFGKFYCCTCPEQKTVSDTYWQKVRRIHTL